MQSVVFYFLTWRKKWQRVVPVHSGSNTPPFFRHRKQAGGDGHLAYVCAERKLKKLRQQYEKVVDRNRKNVLLVHKHRRIISLTLKTHTQTSSLVVWRRKSLLRWADAPSQASMCMGKALYE